MIDGVLKQFGEHHRQWRRDSGRKSTSIALSGEANRSVGRLEPLLGKTHKGSNDLDERHIVAGLTRQSLVNQRNGADSTNALLHRGLGLG